MAEHDFLVKLTNFANTSWPSVKLGHSVGAFDDKYPCANPEGPVDNSGCSDPESPDYDPENPLCMCPCQELNPFTNGDLVDFPWYVDIFTGAGAGAAIWNWFMGNEEEVAEPTKEEILDSIESIKECDYIEDVLGESWKGCLWNDQHHPSSCDCPCVGEDFKRYIDYTRTSATYWETPNHTPLWRDAQMMLINSQKSIMLLNGDLSLRPGTILNITNKLVGEDNKERRFAGRWLISDISHTIQGMSHTMLVTLTRDSGPIDPNTSEELGFFESISDFFGGLFG